MPPSAFESAPAPTAAAESADPKLRTATLTVTGDQDTALVKTVVVDSKGAGDGGRMLQQKLPYTQEITAPHGTNFTKIFIVAKYPNDSTAKITCSISVDSDVLATNTSIRHQPAECLFLEPSNK